MRLLLFPPIPWDYPMRQRPQHLAIQFAASGCRTEYIDVAGPPGDHEEAPGLVRRTPPAGARRRRMSRALGDPFRIARFGARAAWDRAVDPAIERLLDESPRPGAAIVQSPAFAPLIPLLRARSIPIVYDRVDNWPAFPGVPPRWPAYDRTLCEEADILWASHPALLEGLKRDNDGHLIPNGYDPGVFQRDGVPCDEDLPGPPRILYSGTLGDWFDWDLLIHAAAALPEVQWLLVGAFHHRSDDLPTDSLPANVHQLGPRPFAALGAIYRSCAVGIIPFRDSALSRAVDPVKAYEYLASGLPIVATGLPHLTRFPCAIVASDAKAFTGAVARLAMGAHAPDRGSVDGFLADKTWASRAHLALSTLNKCAD